MRKTIFTLLALVASVGMSWATDPIVIVTNTSQSSYTQGNITITCSKPGDSEGFYLDKYDNETATITVSGSSTISQIELGIGWFPDDRSYVRANGAEPTSSDPYSITFSNVNSNNVTLTITNEKIQISDVKITLADEGGSEPATGLQVVEVTSELYAGWNSNSNPFTVDVLPGFQAVTYDEAMEWTEVPTSGTAVLVYRTNGDNARVIQFFDGTIMGDYDVETSFNQIYENITIFGNRFFYTAGGGSTPDPTPTTSGSCGTNVTWEFDPSTGALTITGTGAMDDYLNNASAPWNSYITDITSVTITDGVTNVGNYSFEQCTSLTTVTIGDDVETIGTFAFSECGEQFTTLTLGNSIRTIGNQAFASNYGITGFTLPSTLETIGNHAFIHNRAITTLTIPSNVTSIDKDAFYGCTAVTDVYCYPNAADLTWNEVDCDDFKSGKATICHVNSDQLDAYQTKFNDVVRVTFVGDLDAPAPTPAEEHEITANQDPVNTVVYYSTFFNSTVKYALPAGVQAYVADLSGDELVLTKIAVAGQVIPANTAVILRANAQDFTLTVSDAAPVSFSANNDLLGVDVNTAVSSAVTSGTCYVLSGNNEDGIGFFQYASDKTLGAHKAYVVVESGLPAPRRMRFVFENEQTATGVDQMVNGKCENGKLIRDGQLYILRNGVRYNAQGQIVK